MRSPLTTPTPRHQRIAAQTPSGTARSGAGTWVGRVRRGVRALGDAPHVVPVAPAAVVQERLRDIGLLSAAEVTRRWDRPTVRALEDFQRARGLAADGIAGPATVDLLLAAA